MKTFTNCAEKKAKQFLNLLQGYTKGIRITAILILLLMGVSNVWGGNNITFQSGAFFYFDPYYSTTQTVDKGYIQLAARKYQNSGQNDYGWYTAVTTLTKIANTRLYYTSTFEGPAWPDAGLAFHGWAMISNSTAKGNGTTEYWTGSNSSWYSEFKNYGLNKNSTYLFVATSASKGQSIQPNGTGYLSGGYSALNSTQTIKTAVNGADANSKATISITSYKMTGNGQVTEQTATLGTDAKDSSVDAARTATTTLTVGDVATGYQFDGWYAAKTGGTALSTSTTYTYYPTAATTVYARFSEKKYTVTVNNDGHGTTTPSGAQSNVGQETGLSIKATPAANYEFVNWTITSGSGSFGSTTSASTTFKPTSAATVQANFRSTVTYSLTVAAGNGISQVAGSTDPITLGNKYDIKATPETGYTFSSWTANPVANATFESQTSAQTKVTVKNGSVTVTASATENMSTLTTSNKYDAGNPGYADPTKSVSSIGIATTATVTATAAGNGYTFTGWTLTNCTRTDGGADNATSITVRSNGDGKAATVVANYAEDLTTSWVLKGSFVDDFKTAYDFVKKSGESTGTVAYVTLELAANTAYRFKVVNGSTWYGNNNSDEKWWITATTNDWVFYSDAGNCHMKSSVAGTYTFKIDFSGTDPKVSVLFPTAYKITYGVGTNKGTDEVTTNPSVSSGSLVLASTSITFSKGDTKTGYTWKNWNNKNDGTGTVLGTGDTYVSSNREADITVYACYDLVTYNITYNTNGGTNPNNAQTSYNVTTATFNLPTPTKTGYTFAGWYDNAGLTGNKITQIAKGSTGHKEFWAKWTPNTYNITYKDQGGSDFSGTHADGHPTTHTYGIETTLKTASKTGYTFDGWHTDAACTQNVTSLNATAYTAAITLYAKWKALSFELTWDPNGGTITTPGSPEGGEVEAGTPLKAPTVTKEHYDNTGWNPEVPAVMPGEDVTYIAQWTPKEYKITYNLNGGNGTMTPATYTIESETFTLPNNPTKTGHTFAGWYANAELTGDAVIQIEKGSTGDKVYWAKWNVASYTITLDPQGGTGGTTTITTQFEANLPAITIPSREDHLFDGYYTQTGGKGTKYYNADGTTTKTMPHNVSTLYAKWIPYSQCIFFKNNLNWSDVYVYFYSSDKYWDGDKGTGSKKEKEINESKAHYREFRDEMTNITGTDIWYLDYKTMATNVDATYAYEIDNCTNIAFTKDQQYNYEFFDNTEVVRRGDFNHDMQLFVPLLKTKQTADEKNKHDGKVTKYYSSGIWMKYNSTESGYDWRGATDENNQEQWSKKFNFTASKPGGYSFTATVEFDNTSTHYFKIHNTKGDWFGNGGTMTQNNCTDWTFGTDNTKNATITPTITGKYIFTIYLGDGEVSVSLDYPLSVYDYRLVYVDDVDDVTRVHPGHYIKKRNEVRFDTVSFFVHHQNSPRILLQHCTAINSGVPSWKTDKEYQILKTGGADPTSAQLPGKRKSDAVLHVGEGCGIEESGVYNFVLQQSNSQAELSTDATHPYVGNFYIRTDAAAGGWDAFRQAGNKMTYSSYADKNQNFNHYFVKWINAGTNVKFTIANDYSYCLSDTLDADDIVTTGNLPANANVRFGWNSKTNELSRAYIAGSSNASDRFLVLTGNEYLRDIEGNAFPNGTGDRTGLKANEEIFDDMGNWVYQLDVKANTQTVIKLTAQFNNRVQTFFGDARAAADGEEMIDATTPEYHKVRMIYNFKTNHLLAAWLLDREQEINKGEITSNVLIIREDHGEANQLQFNNGLTKMTINTAYAAMTFTKDHVTKPSLSQWQRYEYWVSFPFNVKISDVFGFGEYGTDWIMQLYDGEERAKKGNWIDSPTFWKYITNRNYELQAGVGYVLKLQASKMTEETAFKYSDKVSLYFPSITNDAGNTIISATPDTQHEIPEHECTIDRDNRNIYDSHWNLIGVPGYANIEGLSTAANLSPVKYDNQQVSFYYAYNAADNNYQATSATSDFKNMHSYMVQFAGTINWSTPAVVSPAELAARHNSDAEPEKAIFRLELAQGEEIADQTFVQLQQEGATPEFDMNLDLTKIINSGANIYTLAGDARIQVAGNALPIAETTIPVGVQMATAGEYTFRMPDGTEGMVVELIDYETNTRTNLLLSDYTTTLPAGSFENRFALIVKPDKVATDVENIGQAAQNGEAAKKYIIDGKLFLQKNGMLYDAQGHIVR